MYLFPSCNINAWGFWFCTLVPNTDYLTNPVYHLVPQSHQRGCHQLGSKWLWIALYKVICLQEKGKQFDREIQQR